MSACSLCTFVPQEQRGSLDRSHVHGSLLIDHDQLSRSEILSFPSFLSRSLSVFFSLFRFSRYKVNRSTLARYSRNASFSPPVSRFAEMREPSIYIINIPIDTVLLLSSVLDRSLRTRAPQRLPVSLLFSFFFPLLRFLHSVCTLA